MADLIVSRPFGQNRDFEKILAFARTVAKNADRPELSIHIGDIAWRFYRSNSFQPANAIQIWENRKTNEIVGVGWYIPAHHGVDLIIANRFRGGELEGGMIKWAEQKFRQIPFEKRGHADLKIQLLEWDKKREKLLSRAGYRRDMFYYAWFRYDLTQPIPKPILPDGFVIRPVTTLTDRLAERAELHNQAFFTDGVTQDSYLRVMQSAVYEPDLDLVAVAPDGRLAAFALGWSDPELKTGFFEPVGTHLEFRRLGLAKALLFETMRRMQAAGLRSALLYTEDPNLNGKKLYHAAGFEMVSKQYDWVKAR